MVVEKAAPVDAFVAMESEAALKLVNMVASALSSAQRVFAGSDLLTAQVKSVTTSLAAGQVPRPWDAKWEGPDSPALWLQVAAAVAALRRVACAQHCFYFTWCCACVPRAQVPAACWRGQMTSRLVRCMRRRCLCLAGGGEEEACNRRVARKRARWGDTVTAHLARRHVQPTGLPQLAAAADVAKLPAAGGCG